MARQEKPHQGQPLRQMGAQIRATDGHAPLMIEAVESLRGIDYALPVASAQVKSAILLAGLFADGPTGKPRPITRPIAEQILLQP